MMLRARRARPEDRYRIAAEVDARRVAVLPSQLGTACPWCGDDIAIGGDGMWLPRPRRMIHLDCGVAIALGELPDDLDCVPTDRFEAPDRRESCDVCSVPYTSGDRRVVRRVGGDGRSTHVRCWRRRVEGT